MNIPLPERRLVVLVLFFVIIAILLFPLIEYLKPDILTQPESKIQGKTFATACLAYAVLASDVLLPVPSSFLMTANGRLFGVLTGTLISLFGYVTSGMLGYWIGRCFKRYVYKTASEAEMERAERLTGRWGLFAIILTRPIPILAETVTLCAGAVKMKPGPYLLGLIVGTAPIALLYAITGAHAKNLQAGLVSGAIVVILSGVGWWVGKRI